MNISESWPGPRVLEHLARLGNALLPLASRLPARPGAVLVAAGLNVALARDMGAVAGDESSGEAAEPNAELEPLFGKVIAIRVTDVDVSFRFTVSERGFTACGSDQAPAVVIAAAAADLVRLALRRVDADTLFFSRRLTMEGDTELGLLLKNRLDALDLSWAARSLPPPLELVQALRRAVLPAPRR